MARRILVGLVILSLVAVGVLGYLVVGLRHDLNQAQVVLDQKLSVASARISRQTEVALGRLSEIDSLSSRVSSVEAEVRRHQSALQATAQVFDAQGNVLAAFKSCVNSAFLELQQYSQRIAAYVGLLAVGSVTVEPTFLTPKCF